MDILSFVITSFQLKWKEIINKKWGFVFCFFYGYVSKDSAAAVTLSFGFDGHAPLQGGGIL